MMIRFFFLLISMLLLLNNGVMEVAMIFAPTNAEVLKKINEKDDFQILEYACQFHNCGCTKETCKISCCCKANHEAFNEVKKKETKCHEESNCNKGLSEQMEAKPINIIQKMICKQDQKQQQDKLVLKREPYLLVKQKCALVNIRIQGNTIVESLAYQVITTQTQLIPESPPPIISL